MRYFIWVCYCFYEPAIIALKKNIVLSETKLRNQEIKNTKVSQFKALIKKKTKQNSFKYLSEKQANGKKGREIPYDKIHMADYLLPDDF